MNQQKAIQSFRYWKCTETHILESVLPKGHLEETNRSVYPEARLVQPARCDLLNDKTCFYKLTKVRKGLLGSGRLPSFHSRSPTTYNKCWKGNHWLIPWWRHSQNSREKKENSFQFIPKRHPNSVSWEASWRPSTFRGPIQFNEWSWQKDLQSKDLKFTVHVLLKPGLENFEYYFISVWDECNCAVVWAFFGIALLRDWNENGPFPVLWPLLSFPNLLADWLQHFHSIIFQDLK